MAPGTQHKARVSSGAYCLPDVDVAGDAPPAFRYLSNQAT